MHKYLRKSELTVSCESSSKSRNYLSVLLSLLVLFVISSMIVAAIVIINPEITNLSAGSVAPREAITLDEALLGELTAAEFNFQWSSSSKSTVRNNLTRISLQDELVFEDSKNIRMLALPSSGHSDASHLPPSYTPRRPSLGVGPIPDQIQSSLATLVANNSLLASINYQGFKLSPSKRYLLIWTAYKRRFRHSSTARYFLYDTKLDLISMLSTRPSAQATGDQGLPPSPLAYNSYESLDSATPYLNGDLSSMGLSDDEHTRFQLVDWFSSPASQRESLILVQHNDIYLLRDVSSDNQNIDDGSLNRNQQAPTRLTFTGKEGEIFNGVPDWLYEEEILADAPAYQVSPMATTLAYMSFNDSRVATMPFSVYADHLVPKITKIKYPKTGRTNPKVSIHLIDLVSLDGADHRSENDIQLELPLDLGTRQHYINRIKWLTDDKLALIWLNRNQNESFILLCSRSNDWKCEKNLRLNMTGGWLDLTDDLVPLDEQHYLALLYKFEGDDVGYFKHIARVSLTTPNTYNFLTNGRKEVVAINGLDKERSLVYYTSTVELEPGQRQLFLARLDSSSSGSQCVTCSHYPDECLFNYARMSPSAAYYIFLCAGPGVPRTELRSTKGLFDLEQPKLDSLKTADDESLGSPLSGLIRSGSPLPTSGVGRRLFERQAESHIDQLASGDNSRVGADNLDSPDANLLWIIEDNRELREKLTRFKMMPSTMRLKVPIPKTNYTASVLLLLPPQVGPTTTFKGSSPQGSTLRSKRSAEPKLASRTANEQPFYAHYTPDSIRDYVGQLNSGQQFPMVVDVYAGPGSQKVDYRFNIYFGHYLASSRRAVYAMIDGRGSGYQGTKRLFELYHKFGTVEIQDQIDVASYLTRNVSFIDPNKVAIWGWSYGGYAAAMALAQSNAIATEKFRANSKNTHPNVVNSTSDSSPMTATASAAPSNLTSQTDSALPMLLRRANRRAPVSLNGVFECAASVAPVTDWIYYDTAYTERYMSSPFENGSYDDDTVDTSELPSSRRLTRPSSYSPANHWISLNQTANASYFRSSNPKGDQQFNQAQASNLGPTSNPFNLNERYRRASLLQQIANIDRKRFLLIHGTADDNVHFQQSIMLMKELIHKNVLYDTRIYPDQDHAIANMASKLHLGASLSNFFAECFDMV